MWALSSSTPIAYNNTVLQRAVNNQTVIRLRADRPCAEMDSVILSETYKNCNNDLEIAFNRLENA